jgi:hypothetical protein
MMAVSCPHGLDRARCEICRILDPAVGPAGARRPALGANLPGGLATIAVAAVVGLVVLGWVAAAFFAVLRILELLGVAIVAGWLGFQLGRRRSG